MENKKFKVIILSPSRYSLITNTVTELLMNSDANVEYIISRKLFNIKRFFSEFKRDGSRLIKKIWKKFFLREKAYKKKEYENISSYRKKNGFKHKDIKEFKKYGIKYHFCNDLNDDTVIRIFEEVKPDIVIFTGGGLIRENLLERSGEGILNCHMGILPEYRGMDVVEWPILEDQFDKIGVTVHFMDKGVDTGDILRTVKIPVIVNETRADLRERFEPIMCKEMVNTCIDYMSGKIEKKPQKVEDGKQYFIMHQELIKLAERKLETYSGI